MGARTRVNRVVSEDGNMLETKLLPENIDLVESTQPRT